MKYLRKFGYVRKKIESPQVSEKKTKHLELSVKKTKHLKTTWTIQKKIEIAIFLARCTLAG